MKTYENNCKWHFASLERNAGDEGPNSAMSQTFSQFPCSALVRESIQNSLDAVVDENKPVKVCFEHRSFERCDYPNFFELSEHMEACLDNYNDNPTATKIYPAMIHYMKQTEEVGFIRVADYNTKGMDYAGDTKTNKTFYAFVRSAGVSVKQAQGAGGSFGFGKGAFFVMSPINTLVVSTRNTNDECFFEGVTRLCSHWTNGKKSSHMGFYDNNGGAPQDEPGKIPLPFKREETGTSIGIMGVGSDLWLSIKVELVKEVLRNFFVAIYYKKLEVIIDGNKVGDRNSIVIDADHLDELMLEYFPSLKDVRGDAPYNPRPYYEAMKESSIFEADLPTLGNVRAFFKEVPENSTNVIFMRKLYMKVNKMSRNLGNFNGVFICDNDKGNAILGDMENPEHNEWKAENCNKPERETDYDVAKNARLEFENFISDCFNKLLDLSSSDSLQVTDLEKYLPSDAGIPGKGEKGNPFYGTPTGNYSDEEGSSRTTEGELKPYDPKKGRKGNVKEVKKGVFTHGDGGDDTGGTGGKNGGSGGGTSGPGDNFGKGTITDGAGHFKQLVPAEWRPVISKKQGYMDIVIYVDHDINKAELTFEIGRESGSKKKSSSDDVEIIKCTKGVCDKLSIKDVDLKGKARNIIQVAFSDNMSHSLNLGVYENI